MASRARSVGMFEEALPQLVGIHGGIAAVAGVGAGEFAVPVVVEPGRAGPAAAVDVQLDAARDEAVVPCGLVGAGEGREVFSIGAHLLDRGVQLAP